MSLLSKIPIYDLPQGSIKKLDGSTNNKFWILQSDSEANESALQTFLEKILQAIDLDPNKNLCLFSLSPDEDSSLSSLLETVTTPKTIIIFGLSPGNLGMSTRFLPYHLFKLKGNTFLLCDELRSIQSDSNKKRDLWDSLQKVKG
ncbi:MAG: hypothetical protein KDC80_08870 [Saprospiraceae bacterium]|nr:hypothetical protein [Saprospiraceae bacterium]